MVPVHFGDVIFSWLFFWGFFYGFSTSNSPSLFHVNSFSVLTFVGLVNTVLLGSNRNRAEKAKEEDTKSLKFPRPYLGLKEFSGE